MKSNLKRFVRVAIAIVVVVGLIFATRSAITQWNEQRDLAHQRVAEIRQSLAEAKSDDQRHRLEIELKQAQEAIPDFVRLDWTRVALAAGFYAIGLIPGGLVLFEGTRALGYRVRIREAVSAQVVGHLGKYVPGKAMVVVIRAGRLGGCGVPVMAGSVAVFLETLMMMAVGAAIGGCLIFMLPVARWIGWSAFLGGVMATVPTLPPILKRLVQKVGTKAPGPDRGDAATADAGSDAQLAAVSHDWRFFVAAWGWQLLAWGLIGTAFACLVTAIPGISPQYSSVVILAASVASIALAMVVGFASLLPGGAGVRELTLAVVLSPVIGSSQALLAAILARLLFIVVELMAAVVISTLSGWANTLRRLGENTSAAGRKHFGG